MKNKVVQEAEKWVGYLEKSSNKNLEDFTANAGSANYTIFAKKYKEYFGIDLQAQPWCAMFVSVIFRDALGPSVQKAIMPNFSYCPTGVDQFKKLGCWITSNPQKGDVIFFKDSSGVSCHVGIVYNTDNTKVHTIEGNTSSTAGVVANGGCVAKKSYSLNYNRILGYGRPKYTTLYENWADEYLERLINKGYISNPEIWKNYSEAVTKSTAAALIDKITISKSNEIEKKISEHWVVPYIKSLNKKTIVEDMDQWIIRPDEYISSALILALMDKATGGTKDNYKLRNTDHWGRNCLDSLCDKGIIQNPEEWSDFEGTVRRDNFMALMCKTFSI